MYFVDFKYIHKQWNYSILQLQLHDAIYQLRFYSNSLIRILSLSNSCNNVASIQKNRADKSHRVIVAFVEVPKTCIQICFIAMHELH